MAKSRADKLKNLQMPSRSMADEEVEMDLGMEDLGEGEELLEEGEDLLEEGAEGEVSMLEEFSDEELLEELKLRGLTEGEEEEGEELDEELMPEDELEV